MFGRTSSVRMYETGPSKEWNRRSGHTIRGLWRLNCLKPPHDVSGHSVGNCVTELPMACLRFERGLEWYEYSMFFKNRYRSYRQITFANVATHNHFVCSIGAATSSTDMRRS